MCSHLSCTAFYNTQMENKILSSQKQGSEIWPQTHCRVRLAIHGANFAQFPHQQRQYWCRNPSCRAIVFSQLVSINDLNLGWFLLNRLRFKSCMASLRAQNRLEECDTPLLHRLRENRAESMSHLLCVGGQKCTLNLLGGSHAGTGERNPTQCFGFRLVMCFVRFSCLRVTTTLKLLYPEQVTH